MKNQTKHSEAELPNTDSSDSNVSKRWKIYLTGIIWALISIVTFASYAHYAGYGEIDGEGTWMVTDDIMISQRYAQNLANGNGLVFNKGERVEGFSNLLVVLAYGLPIELLNIHLRHIGLVYWGINGILHVIISLMILFAGVKKFPGFWNWLIALIYVIHPIHAQAAATGFSIYLQSILILYAYFRLERGGLVYALILGILPLVHSIMYPVWFGFVLLRIFKLRSDTKRVFNETLLSTLPIATYFIFRIFYYGDIFPNTYYLKSVSVMSLTDGLIYIYGFMKLFAPLGLVYLAIILLSGKEKIRSHAAELLTIFGIYIAFVIKIGGDLFLMRVMFIFFPFLLFSLLLNQKSIVYHRAIKTVMLILIFAQLGIALRGIYKLPSTTLFSDNLEWHKQRILLGRAINMNTKKDDVLAMAGLGYASYASNRRVIDMLGKTDYYIARSIPHLNRMLGHQKCAPEYILSKRPEYIESIYNLEQVKSRNFLKNEQSSKTGYWADVALNPMFKSQYRHIKSTIGFIPLWTRKDLPDISWNFGIVPIRPPKPATGNVVAESTP